MTACPVLLVEDCFPWVFRDVEETGNVRWKRVPSSFSDPSPRCFSRVEDVFHGDEEEEGGRYRYRASPCGSKTTFPPVRGEARARTAGLRRRGIGSTWRSLAPPFFVFLVVFDFGSISSSSGCGGGGEEEEEAKGYPGSPLLPLMEMGDDHHHHGGDDDE